MPAPLHELELLTKLRGGEADALTAIYHLYAEKMLSSAYNLLKDRAACEDIIQETFLSLWQKRESLEITTSLEGWLFTATRYQVFKVIRKGRVTEPLFEGLETRIWGEPSAENLLYQKELQSRLKGIVDSLPERCREIYRLSREEQLSHKEIAQRLSISTKTIEFQITVALKRIRLSLGELLPLIVLFLGQK